MKTILHLWLYLAQFFVEQEMFQAKVVEEIKTHISWFLVTVQLDAQILFNVFIYL